MSRKKPPPIMIQSHQEMLGSSEPEVSVEFPEAGDFRRESNKSTVLALSTVMFRSDWFVRFDREGCGLIICTSMVAPAASAVGITSMSRR